MLVELRVEYRKFEGLENADGKNSAWYFGIKLSFGKYFVGLG